MLLGDSIASGFGLRDPSLRYGQLVATKMDLELYDLSASAQMISASLDRLRAAHQTPRLAIIAHGITEAIPRPTMSALSVVPPRYRRLGWLDPRPYYASREPRRSLHRCESALRWRTKVGLLKFGHMQLMSPDQYGRVLDETVRTLRAVGAKVVILGPPDLSETYFPGAAREQCRYASAPSSPTDVDLRGRLDLWGDFLLDRFHPNEFGHATIARALCQHLHSQNWQ